jgi:bifunctional DNase/RNase
LFDVATTVNSARGRIVRPSHRLIGVFLGAWLCACSSPEPVEIEVKVRGVEIDTAARPLVLLEDERRQLGLPIWIGPTEAQAIAMEMEGIQPKRPLTHDLFKTTLESAGVQLEKIVIADLKESTYYARIHLTANGTHIEVDSRPSDAIALALRFERPVFVVQSLFRSESAIDLRAIEPSESVAREAGVTVQDVTPELAAHFELSPGEGVIVADIDSGKAAGLQRGDVILAIDGETVGSAQDFSRRMRERYSALPVQLSVLRDGDRFPLEIGDFSR